MKELILILTLLIYVVGGILYMDIKDQPQFEMEVYTPNDIIYVTSDKYPTFNPVKYFITFESVEDQITVESERELFGALELLSAPATEEVYTSIINTIKYSHK